MTTKDFNLAYREAVSLMLRRLRAQALSESSRVTDKMLASSLRIQSNTFSRLYRRCFNASPVVLMRLYFMLGSRVFDQCLNEAGLMKTLDLLHFDSGCPRDCHGDCEFCAKG